MAMSTRSTITIARTVTRSVASKNQSETKDRRDLLTDLFTAYFCARKNKRNTSSQVRFERDLPDNLMRLYNEIVSGRYQVGRSMCFIINDPVKREVFAASFRDRIVHHLLYNWLMPVFEPTFIHDSYSCREGKGTLFGIQRLEHHIRSCSDNYRKECFVLRLDIEGYFMNINRGKLFDIVVRRLERCCRCHSVPFDVDLAKELLSKVIFNDPVKGCYRKGPLTDWDGLPESKSLFHAPPGCGLPIGNLTSQLFSNIYLSSFDDFMKREMKFRHYGRYVDDFYIVSNHKGHLLESIPKIRHYLLSELGLRLHSRKVHLTSVNKGVVFLGSVIKPYQRYMTAKARLRAVGRYCEALCNLTDPYVLKALLQSYCGYVGHYTDCSFR